MEKQVVAKRSVQAVAGITTLTYSLVMWLVGLGNHVTLSYAYAAKFILNIGAMEKNLSINLSPGIRIGWPIFNYHYWDIIITPAVVAVFILIAVAIEFVPYFKKKKEVKVKKVEEKPQAPRISEFVPTKYKLVFDGTIQDGTDKEAVKKNIAKLYRVPLEKCEKMFSGKPVVIKDRLDKTLAQKYKKAFEQTGAICQVHVSI